MAATLIAPTDPIDVSSLSVCIYGPPGTGKTSLAQTAAEPITLDLDRGVHRSFNRQAAMRFDAWRDIEAAWSEIAKRKTVIVDTVGRALDVLTQDIISANAKHGSSSGGLSLQGFGALKARFAQWNGQLFQAGKDRVLIAHEKEDKDGDDRFFRPDVQGGSYTEIMKSCDLVGYLYRDRNGKRMLDFNPSDRHLGKNAARWPVMEVPDLADAKTFLADLLCQAKQVIGRTSEASAQTAKTLAEWQARLTADITLDQLNAMLPEVKGLEKQRALAAQVWKVFETFAGEHNLAFDKKAKKFVVKKDAA